MALSLPPVDLAAGRRMAALLDEVARLSRATARLRPTGTDLARAIHDHVEATLTLDGSDRDPEDEVAAGIRAREVAGCATALNDTTIGAEVTTDPAAGLARLHATLTDGLVAPERRGTPRVSEQAVQDGAIGRVVYFPVAAERVADELGRLAAWVVEATGRMHPVLVAGVLHLELLRIHPFDAANGRLARAAARHVLWEAGIDPHRLARTDTVLATDPLGYHEQVAGTLRRRATEVWLEYWAETVAEGLRLALAAADVAPPSARSSTAAATATTALVAALADHDGDEITVAELSAGAGGRIREDDAGLQSLVDAGLLRRVRGSRGLRYRRTGH